MSYPAVKYITFQDLCLKLGGRSRSSIYRDIKKGRIPRPIKIGARVLWREDELQAALDSIRVLNGDENA